MKVSHTEGILNGRRFFFSDKSFTEENCLTGFTKSTYPLDSDKHLEQRRAIKEWVWRK